jgi:hypothetical protein
MRRRLLILLFIGLALIFTASQFWPSDPTQADQAAIRRVIGRRTAQPIDDVQILASGAVRVWTSSRETAEGDVFGLRKFFGQWWVYSREHRAERIERGVPERPANPMELAGRFVKSDFTTAISLTLCSNGTYSAQWEADVGNGGEAAGSWRLSGTELVLAPVTESGLMRDYLRTLDIYRFQSKWLLVAARDRKNYERFGVVPGLLHFQKDERE